MNRDENYVKHFIGMLVGVVGMGFGVSLLIRVDLGTDPFSSFCLGLSRRSGLSLGTCELLFNAVLLLIELLIDRSMIGWGTIGNMVLVGYSADFFSFLWNTLGWFPVGMALPLRVVLLVPSLIGFTLAAALYMTAQRGVAPYDALPFLMQKRIGRISFRWVRMAWDWLWITISLVVGGPVGIVTILIAMALGPVVAWVGEWTAHCLYGDVGTGRVQN